MANNTFLESRIPYEYNFFSDFDSFEDMPDWMQEDLKSFMNVSPIDSGDEKTLYNLYQTGTFSAWDCPECGERCYKGDPNDWNDFQGALIQDFSSFPGNHIKFTSHYLEAMCNSCRAKN